jgi:hypothetical protein
MMQAVDCTRYLTRAILLFVAAGCAATGASVPSKGTEAFENGPWPEPSALPVVEMDQERLAEFMDRKAVLCEKTPDGMKVDHAALLGIRSGLYTWIEPQGGSLQEILIMESIKLLTDSVAEMQGQIRIEKIGVRCVDEGAVIRLNDKALGPYDRFWGQPIPSAAMPAGYAFIAFSSETNELVFIFAPISTVMGTFILTDIGRYVPDAGAVEMNAAFGRMGWRLMVFDRAKGEGLSFQASQGKGGNVFMLSKVKSLPKEE